MFGNGIESGEERGVVWRVDTLSYDPILVTVTSAKGSKTVEVKCWHKPIFGYDIDDLQRVEEVLDRLINEYATE